MCVCVCVCVCVRARARARARVRAPRNGYARAGRASPYEFLCIARGQLIHRLSFARGWFSTQSHGHLSTGRVHSVLTENL